MVNEIALRFLGVAALALMPLAAPAAALTPAQVRGKQIYLHGTSPSGAAVTASFGGDGNDLPGETFPCANCHGRDGRGKPEGDVTPSNIRWSELTRLYGADQDGRKHSPYTERTLKRAITLGLDPAGQALNPVMPRFHLAWQDLDDLVAYVKKLEDDLDPGLSPTSISIGVVLPPAESMSAVADAIRAVLDAYAANLNQQGGIFGRQLDLHYASAPFDPAAQPAALRDFLDREKPFALAASYLIQSEEADSRLLSEQQTPLIGGFTLFPWVSPDLRSPLFYLDGGVPAEIDALVDWVSRRRGTEGNAVILGMGNPGIDEPAANAFRGRGWKSVAIWRPGQSLDSSVVILCLGGESGAAALRAASLPSHPIILMPGSLQDPDVMTLPGADQGRVALAFSWLPGDQPEGAELYRQLGRSRRLPAAYSHSQFLALASLLTLAEGLKRSGRELSREKLLQSLDTLNNFRTGITPPLTFSPGSRIGSRFDTIYLASPQTHSLIPSKEFAISR